jgi:hypothetical protein
MNRSVRPVTEAISSTERDEVLVAKIVFASQMPESVRKTSFHVYVSETASMMISQPFRSP